MKDSQREAAQRFAERWAGKGDEKGQSQPFWLQLLRDVYGVREPEQYISFEMRVKDYQKRVQFIDGYIEDTKVLIEQKKLGTDLDKKEEQSDGTLLTPYEQALRYDSKLPRSKRSSYIVECNFQEFRVHDTEKPNSPPEVILLKDLGREYNRLQFLVNPDNAHLQQQLEVSVKAGELVGKLYDAFHKQYKDPNSQHALHSLNVLCVRLVFCLYAEDDTDLFGRRDIFHDYLDQFPTNHFREALRHLFEVLDTPYDERDPYLAQEGLLGKFPYVNGGLFADRNVEIPPFTPEIRELLLREASLGFDWSKINPTIFGAVFESTLNPETRRSGGMHYTSVENIHKVIDPLFMDRLYAEFRDIRNTPTPRLRLHRLLSFQDDLSKLTFLDPACGSGNFLTESYLSLRRLENEALRLILNDRQSTFTAEGYNPVKVSISQFHGIEINDFAVSVAKTALWIAEMQMLSKTKEIMRNDDLVFLPLKSNTTIVEGNALRLPWQEVIPPERLSYIIGNPPFVGYSLQTKEQKEDILSVYVDEKGKPYKTAGKIDYVAAWYFKAAEMMQGTNIRAALVATNSITQGEQVAGVWKPLFERFGIHIDFAHRTFRWDSEASLKAHVHCVIVGFSAAPSQGKKYIYTEGVPEEAGNINGYLVDAANVFIGSRSKPLCDVPLMTTGNRPTDGGHLIIEADEYDDFIRREPKAAKYIKKLIGSEEYINNKERWCLWLVGVSPSELRSMPLVMKRVEQCKLAREASPDPSRRKLATTPTLFRELNNPDAYVLVPKVSSERRRYVPIGLMDGSTISTDLNFIIPNASLYHFGVLTSSVHMAWMRAVGGRLKSDYRYSKDIVYNNFPWPQPTTEQRERIEQTAREILRARDLYPQSSLADLYDEVSMPAELRQAHQRNDRAVQAAYGWTPGSEPARSEPACVSRLMQMYQTLA